MSRIISFSSDDDFSDNLDQTIEKSGYKNRSRFMRDAVFHFADYKQRGELSNMKGDELLEGHLIIYYQHGIEKQASRHKTFKSNKCCKLQSFLLEAKSYLC